MVLDSSARVLLTDACSTHGKSLVPSCFFAARSVVICRQQLAQARMQS